METVKRRGRLEGVNEDHPVYSRLFIVCGKLMSETQLRTIFIKFGTIEDMYAPIDYTNGGHKGIAFIKYSKTSEAARAVQEMHMKVPTGGNKPLKVMVACSRSSIQTDDTDNPDKYKRIFIHVPKSGTEEELTKYFSAFGNVELVTVQRDKNTWESKGFAYITFQTFLEAATAFEQADSRYKAIFAQPKTPQRRKPETSYESNINLMSNVSLNNTLLPLMNVQPQGYMSVLINCAPGLLYNDVANLFDLVPGMVSCKYAVDLMGYYGKGLITYSSPISAAYAVQKLDGFEYPPGHPVKVKPDYSSFKQDRHFEVPTVINNLQTAMSNASSSNPDWAQLAQAIAEASKLIKTATMGIADQDLPDSKDLNYCSVSLPPPQPLAHIDAPVAKRCFLVCKPQPPPLKVLRDVFCRFGDLINVYTLPNKTVGYVRYASVKAADEAMKALHGAELCGIRIKVLEAEDDDRSGNKRRRHEF